MTRTAVQEITRVQRTILDELRQIKTKITLLGSLERFENIAKKGREFAKQNNLKLEDVLKND